MEIIESKKLGYKTVLSFKNNVGWRIGIINYAEKFDKDNITYLEKHNLTDEAFILLNGTAHLLLGENFNRVELKAGKVYNVKCDEWHNIILSKDATVVVVENINTSADNTEYFSCNYQFK